MVGYMSNCQNKCTSHCLLSPVASLVSVGLFKSPVERCSWSAVMHAGVLVCLVLTAVLSVLRYHCFTWWASCLQYNAFLPSVTDPGPVLYSGCSFGYSAYSPSKTKVVIEVCVESFLLRRSTRMLTVAAGPVDSSRKASVY